MPEKKLVNPENGNEFYISYDEGDTFLMIQNWAGERVSGNTHTCAKPELVPGVYRQLIRNKLSQGFIDPEGEFKTEKAPKEKNRTKKELPVETLKEWWKKLDTEWKDTIRDVLETGPRMNDSILKQICGTDELDLADRDISDIAPLSVFINLTSLNLYGTGISDLSPLKTLTGLKSLDIGNCTEVDDISHLSSLKNLEDLDLSYTSVTSLKPVESLKRLKRLVLEGLDREMPDFAQQKKRISEKIPDCRIVTHS